jgi:hypothetical protein
MVHFWLGFFFPKHFQKSVFSKSHGYKTQARKPSIAEQPREHFFRAASRTGANHSLFNIYDFVYATLGLIFSMPVSVV